MQNDQKQDFFLPTQNETSTSWLFSFAKLSLQFFYDVKLKLREVFGVVKYNERFCPNISFA